MKKMAKQVFWMEMLLCSIAFFAACFGEWGVFAGIALMQVMFILWMIFLAICAVFLGLDGVGLLMQELEKEDVS